MFKTFYSALYSICNILFFIGNLYAVPPDFCFAQLNQSDCNLRPTPVFTYYKPGSRCEIAFWRGCPTMNKFHNEYDCSHLCIAKFSNKASAEEPEYTSTSDEISNPCMERLNTTNCYKNKTTVFTFQDGNCVEAIWRGCPSQNKFPNEDSCAKACKHTQLSNVEAWQTTLYSLDEDEITYIDNVLEEIMENIQGSLETTTQDVNTDKFATTDKETDAVTKKESEKIETLLQVTNTEAMVTTEEVTYKESEKIETLLQVTNTETMVTTEEVTYISTPTREIATTTQIYELYGEPDEVETT